ncbi:SAM-dependent methyltransferase [Streptomyces sp. NPDC018031]|uniref:SAM-dependent methyltransferase n=1 Tax=Streptomyces sp. NPDC018031 TaxID=3365033 RepID=UPI0037BCD526
MMLKALMNLAGSDRPALSLTLARQLSKPVYRACFLASAASSGVLRRLADRPSDVPALMAALDLGTDRHRLRVWLDVGVRLGDLRVRDGHYRLRSRAAKVLARPDNDCFAAMVDQLVRHHGPLLADAPDMLREGRRLSLADQDGPLVARVSRVLEPAVESAVERVVRRRGPVRLLELGCGSGTYVRYAASLNPELTAVAVDLRRDVVEQAAANLAGWGLADRVETRVGDLRTLRAGPEFDLVTLHNAIYYFPSEERVAVLARARSFLAPGGTLLLTTGCRGGPAALHVLDLWCQYGDFGGPLPRAAELAGQLASAGLAGVRSHALVPGGSFRAFVGTNAPHGAHPRHGAGARRGWGGWGGRAGARARRRSGGQDPAGGAGTR